MLIHRRKTSKNIKALKEWVEKLRKKYRIISCGISYYPKKNISTAFVFGYTGFKPLHKKCKSIIITIVGE